MKMFSKDSKQMNSFIVQSKVAFNFNETNNRTSIDFLQFPK